jgi:hypothetical protein
LPALQPGKGKTQPVSHRGRAGAAAGDDLDLEEPLLLNPYLDADCAFCGQYLISYGKDEYTGPDNIRQRVSPHLRYIFEADDEDLYPTGVVKGVTPRGVKSVEVYDLNREALVKIRKRSQRAALDSLHTAQAASNQRFRKMFLVWLAADQEHATAVRAACYALLDYLDMQLKLTRAA